ncbi:TPA: DUF5455 family protein [Providencia stuartii]|uniref:DUF5455 family protein n=1 Tax=Providencia stuartii TaxID=588 RepID=UPI002AB4375B|nr:DUF5455 family protein [Providencia stuartii]
MPVLLGIPAIIRFLIGLVPLFLGYIASFLTKLITRTGIIAFAFVSLLALTISSLINYLSGVVSGYIPSDYSGLISSVLPDSFLLCVNVIMVTRITIFFFDLKSKFLDYANRIL